MNLKVPAETLINPMMLIISSVKLQLLMKRFSEKAIKEELKSGAIIRFYEWFTLNAGYKVIINDEIAGYITYTLFEKLYHNNIIVKSKKDFYQEDYILNITEETEETEENNNIIVEEVNDEKQHIKIPGYVGKWSAFEKCTINNKTYYIMEHDYYGDETTLLVISFNNTGQVIEIYETFDNIIICLTDYLNLLSNVFI